MVKKCLKNCVMLAVSFEKEFFLINTSVSISLNVHTIISIFV